MNIDIQTRDFSLTGSIAREVEKRIVYPLARRHDQISHITVRLGDINGPRGGKDKYCRIKVDISGQKKDVYVENIESDMYKAIYRAAERASRSVLRRITRTRERPVRYVSRNAEKLLTASNGQIME